MNNLLNLFTAMHKPIDFEVVAVSSQLEGVGN